MAIANGLLSLVEKVGGVMGLSSPYVMLVES